MKKWTQERLLQHWTIDSLHEDYIEGKDRSGVVVKLIEDVWPDRSISILELGCNIGRNLQCLIEAGYTNVHGIDVSPRAFPFMQNTFPDVASEITFHEGTIEEHIVEFADGQYDIVFTMAVLMHIHPDSEWVFNHMARIARLGIVTVELESVDDVRLWPRDYVAIFENLGLAQTTSHDCKGYSKLSDLYWARRFEK